MHTRKAILPAPSNATRIRPGATQRKLGRRHQRGAILVEGTIVVAALSLGLLALIFFKDVYVKKLGVTRLARAAAVTHSMLGCGDVPSSDWVGADLGTYMEVPPQEQSENANGGLPPDASASSGEPADRSATFLERIGGLVDDGAGVVNPITRTGFSGTAAATKSTTPGENTFEAPVASRSFVSCGDTVRDGDIESLVGYLREDLIGIKNSGQ